jgi:trimeric autotransporter adhesin
MPSSRLALALIAPLALSGCFFDIADAPEALEPGALVTFGGDWRYQPGAFEAGWMAIEHDDSAWQQGVAPLGYGDCAIATEIANNCPPGNCSDGSSFNCPQQFIAYYFRHRFELPSAAGASQLYFDGLFDDGAVVHLNGVEVTRLRMPAGTIGPTTEATAPVSGEKEGLAERIDADPSLLRAGTNVVAVEVHQEGPGTDVLFDIALFVE